MVKALRYKPVGRGFDSRWCQDFSPWHNPAGRTMSLGSTQPLTEMSTRCVSCHQEFSWGKGGRRVWLTTYHHYNAFVTKTRSLNSPGPLRAYMACSGTTLPFYCTWDHLEYCGVYIFFKPTELKRTYSYSFNTLVIFNCFQLTNFSRILCQMRELCVLCWEVMH